MSISHEKLNILEGFPSGQRGQTVNLLSQTSMVRIHPPPPRKHVELVQRAFNYIRLKRVILASPVKLLRSEKSLV